MGAIVKDSTSQLLAAETPRAIPNDSPTPVRIIDLNEAQQLSQFTTVLVLVPATSSEGGRTLSQIAKNNVMGAPPEAFNILEFFNRNTTLSKTRTLDSDFVVGDVKVDFSTMEANRSGVPLIVTALEFKTLKYLIQNARRLISRDELLKKSGATRTIPRPAPSTIKLRSCAKSWSEIHLDLFTFEPCTEPATSSCLNALVGSGRSH